uniref:Uncharacterized protein MANES_10G078100 n=1 Tax=Rhizophora mucronata TaxID=61149 RepID=A0A2P2MGH9_RHIMU
MSATRQSGLTSSKSFSRGPWSMAVAKKNLQIKSQLFSSEAIESMFSHPSGSPASCEGNSMIRISISRPKQIFGSLYCLGKERGV